MNALANAVAIFIMGTLSYIFCVSFPPIRRQRTDSCPLVHASFKCYWNLRLAARRGLVFVSIRMGVFMYWAFGGLISKLLRVL